MSFKREFDDILAEILADIRGRDPLADLSPGSVLMITASRLASATWGLYKYQTYIAAQAFTDTAERPSLDRDVYCLGLPVVPGEDTEALRARILAKKRRPPAGGNKYDYEDWARQVPGVADAHCVRAAQGAGTVDVVVLAAGDNEVPSVDLLNAVYAYIDDLRPEAVGTFRVLAPQVVTQNLTMPVVGAVDLSVLDLNIAAAAKKLRPGQTLVLSQLAAIALDMGATDAGFTLPAGNVTATEYQIIRVGAIAH